MKFSLSLPVWRDPDHRDPFHQTFALAQIAEEAGFDTATIGHHHFLPGNMSDPLTFMTAVAARTSTLRVVLPPTGWTSRCSSRHWPMRRPRGPTASAPPRARSR